MMRLKIYLSIWHSTISTGDLIALFPFPVINKAEKGDLRGKSGSIYKESYCRFDLGYIESNIEAEIISGIIELLDKMEGLSNIEGKRRIWITGIMPSTIYEISISPDEMKKLSIFDVGLSFDISNQSSKKEK